MKAKKPRGRPRIKSRSRQATLKDRLVQTRVPEDLESALKDEARKRRLSVSHLIRNMLEDTFHLVDNVVAEVDNLVHESVDLARQVRRDAGRIADTARAGSRERTARDQPSDAKKEGATNPTRAPAQASNTATPSTDSTGDSSALDHVLAWNKVVLNRDAVCAKCGAAMPKGSPGHLGISSHPGAAPVWLCDQCL